MGRCRTEFFSINALRGIIVLICVLALFSCGAETIVHPATPIENDFTLTHNNVPGIYVKLRMESGKELLFLIDTGRPNTSIDKSLEPLLGKRLRRSLFFEPLIDGVSFADVYKAPKLYLGNTPLLTNSKIYAFDWQRLGQQPGVMGVLGMDCLKHYCVQFDFAHNKIRFLDPDHPDQSDLGTPFPLIIIDGLLIARADCFGAGKAYFCPDTGDSSVDATIKPSLFRRKLKEQKPLWTYPASIPGGASTELAGFTTSIFAGKIYTHLTFNEWYSPWPDGDLIGLPFLARNLVTFNFPKRVMYLKQETSAPRLQDDFPLVEAMNYMNSLSDKGLLPGLSTNDAASGDCPDAPKQSHFPITLTFSLTKFPPPHWVDLTPRIQLIVANGVRVIRADNKMAGCDPARGYTKQLKIDFTVGKLRRIARALEGQTVTLPAGVEIIRVRYGSPQGTLIDPTKLNQPIDDSQYHYTLAQQSLDGPWKLQKAWRSDKKGHVIEQYPQTPIAGSPSVMSQN